ADHTLVLQVDSRLVPLVERWLPRYLDEPSPAVTPRATIEAVVAASEAPRPAGAATLALGSVQAWLATEPGPVQLHGLAAGSSGTVDLISHRATLCADPAAAGSPADVYSMLTVASALLLASLGGALVDGGGVVAPEGGGAAGGWGLVAGRRGGGGEVPAPRDPGAVGLGVSLRRSGGTLLPPRRRCGRGMVASVSPGPGGGGGGGGRRGAGWGSVGGD